MFRATKLIFPLSSRVLNNTLCQSFHSWKPTPYGFDKFTHRPFLPPLPLNTQTRTFTTGEKLHLSSDGNVYKIVLPLAHGDCLFSLNSSNTVKNLIDFILEEDFSADASVWSSQRRYKVSGNTVLKDILPEGFEVCIRGTYYQIPPIPIDGTLPFREIIDANAILQNEKYSKVRSALKDDVRNSLSFSEYLKICESFKVSEQEARNLLRSLHHAGFVLYFEQNKLLTDTIFLHPREITQQVLHSLEVPPTIVADIEKRINEINEEMKPLDEKRAVIELAAEKYANRCLVFGFGALCGQFAVLARLVWWELNWDIMEPVAYFIGLGTTIGGFVFFSFTGRDYGFNDLWEHTKEKKKKRLAARERFDESKYNQLIEELNDLKTKRDKMHLKAKMT